jgi:hypothetical protein
MFILYFTYFFYIFFFCSGLKEAGAKYVCRSTFVPELFDLLCLQKISQEPKTNIGRKAKISRSTKETNVFCEVNLDGVGLADVETGIGFLDHMICALSKHSHIDIALKCKGILEMFFLFGLNVCLID